MGIYLVSHQNHPKHFCISCSLILCSSPSPSSNLSSSRLGTKLPFTLKEKINTLIISFHFPFLSTSKLANFFTESTCFQPRPVVLSLISFFWNLGFIFRASVFLMGFPGSSDGKASAYNAGDPGSIPGSGRSPGEGNSNPLQYSCLENPMDWGAWWATVHGVAKSRTQLSDFSLLYNWKFVPLNHLSHLPHSILFFCFCPCGLWDLSSPDQGLNSGSRQWNHKSPNH